MIKRILLLCVIWTNGLVGLPLFEAHPTFQDHFAHTSLGEFPTPVIELENLSKALGASLYLKDDGVSGTLFGGNKVRKLEFLLADALDSGAKSVIVCGDAGSNCSLATIAWATHMGFDAYSMLGSQLRTAYARRNLLMSLYYGGRLSYYDSYDEILVQRPAFAKRIAELDGVEPYIVPGGGSSCQGMLGFVNAAFELKQQIEAGELPEPDYIYVALGSTGTSAGLILGLKLAGLKTKVIPVGISGKNGDITYRTVRLVNKLNSVITFLKQADPNLDLQPYEFSDIVTTHNFKDCTYAQVTHGVASVIKLLYIFEGIKLDGTYTGKAFCAMLNDLKKPSMKHKTVLFWNTYCAGSFDHITRQVDYRDLPQAFHTYFEEDVQALDQGA